MSSAIQPEYIDEVFDCVEKLVFSLASIERQREIFRILYRSGEERPVHTPECVSYGKDGGAK